MIRRRVVATFFLSACSASSDMAAPAAATVHGIQFARAIQPGDSARVAAFGQVLSVVRKDSAMVVLTTASVQTIASVPGVEVVCQSMGTSPTVNVEVELGVGPLPIDSAVALARILGTVHLADSTLGIVDALIPANRLHELDDYPIVSYAYVVACPRRQVSSAN